MIRTDSRKFAANSRWVRAGFAQIRAGFALDSRRFAQIRTDFRFAANSHRFAQVRTSLPKRTTQIRRKFAANSHRFADVSPSSPQIALTFLRRLLASRRAQRLTFATASRMMIGSESSASNRSTSNTSSLHRPPAQATAHSASLLHLAGRQQARWPGARTC